jgi:hypothetical protein
MHKDALDDSFWSNRGEVKQIGSAESSNRCGDKGAWNSSAFRIEPFFCTQKDNEGYKLMNILSCI